MRHRLLALLVASASSLGLLTLQPSPASADFAVVECPDGTGGTFQTAPPCPPVDPAAVGRPGTVPTPPDTRPVVICSTGEGWTLSTAAVCPELLVPAPATALYVVKPGDTLRSIARQFYGSGRQWRRIAAANPGTRPRSLRPGAILTLPVG